MDNQPEMTPDQLEKILASLRSTTLSRRHFLRVAATAGGAAVFAALNIACGGGDSYPSVSPAPTGGATDPGKNEIPAQSSSSGLSKGSINGNQVEEVILLPERPKALIDNFYPQAKKELYVEHLSRDRIDVVNLGDYRLSFQALINLEAWLEKFSANNHNFVYSDGTSSSRFGVKPRPGNKLLFVVSSLDQFPDQTPGRLSYTDLNIKKNNHNITSVSFMLGQRDVTQGLNPEYTVFNRRLGLSLGPLFDQGMELAALLINMELAHAYGEAERIDGSIDPRVLQESWAISIGLAMSARSQSVDYNRYRKLAERTSVDLPIDQEGRPENVAFVLLPRRIYYEIPNGTLLMPNINRINK